MAAADWSTWQQDEEDPEVVRGASGKVYYLDEPLGSGASGTVYQASEGKSRSQVAVKVFSPAEQKMFVPENQIQKYLTEQNIQGIPQWLDQARPEDIEAGQAYIVTTLAPGRELHDYLLRWSQGREDWLPQVSDIDWSRSLVGVAKELVSILLSIEHECFTHRDVKPENVMLAANGKVTLVDLGLACIDDACAAELLSKKAPVPYCKGESVGTSGYMPPEARDSKQKQQQPFDKRDAFAVAKICTDMFCGGKMAFFQQNLQQRHEWYQTPHFLIEQEWASSGYEALDEVLKDMLLPNPAIRTGLYGLQTVLKELQVTRPFTSIQKWRSVPRIKGEVGEAPVPLFPQKI